jgi:transcriptional regulator with XRE-family HTH domain
MDQASALRQARETARMSQAHLSTAAGVSKRTIIRAEQGLRIQDENLRCLCSVLGLNASSLNVQEVLAPVTPHSLLRDHVSHRGEGILWEGAPDASAWRNEVRYDALMCVYLLLIGLSLLATWLYVQSLRSQSDGLAIAMGWRSYLAAAGAVASAYMVSRAIGAFRRARRSSERLSKSLHVLTEKAFYTAQVASNDRNTVARIERVDLGDDRDGCRVQGRSTLWPRLKSIPIFDMSYGTMGRTVHIEGIPDLQGLATLMRGELQLT